MNRDRPSGRSSVTVQTPDLQQPPDAKLIEQSLAEPEVFAVLFDRYAADSTTTPPDGWVPAPPTT
jgi:hypothetical protein